MKSCDMIDCLTAKQTLAQIVETLDFYFPPALRARCESIAEEFKTKSQMYWIERARAKYTEIAEAFRKLGQWTDMEDSELLMRAWDDEVLFFYVLRTQVLLALALTFIAHTARSTPWWLALTSAVLLALIGLYSVLLPVPINNQVARWQPDTVPPNWRDLRRRWDILHAIRVAVLIVALTLLVASCVY